MRKAVNLQPICLDDLYKMVAYTYSDLNPLRPASATFAHFVEVCGDVTVKRYEKRKMREWGKLGGNPRVKKPKK